MIGSRADNVAALLERFGKFREELNLNARLRSRADELEEAASRLDEPSKQVVLQRERKWLNDSKLPSADVDKLRALIAKLRELLSVDPGKINATVNRLVTACEKLAGKANETTKSAWEEVLKRRQPRVAEADLNRCEQFNSEAAKVEEIRRLCRISVAHVPSDRDALHEIEKRWDRLHELIVSLPKVNDNPDVNRFLDAVRKGGAPLALLTDVVRQYLDETGKSDAFRIYQDR